MGVIRPPAPVKLICALLSSTRPLLAEAAIALARVHGPVDFASEVMPFGWTEYYRDEMGDGIARQFLSFERLIQPDEIAAIKARTNQMEEEFAARATADGGIFRRPLNLDPGYLTESKLVMASTKGLSHRIYLSHGIYAEVTLNYFHGRWQGQVNTFPDYASGAYDAFFSEVRTILRRQLGKEQ